MPQLVNTAVGMLFYNANNDNLGFYDRHTGQLVCIPVIPSGVVLWEVAMKVELLHSYGI